MIDSGLRPFASRAQQSVLMSSFIEIAWQADRTDDLQPLDMREHRSGTGRTGGKLEPGERTVGRLTASLQQTVER